MFAHAQRAAQGAAEHIRTCGGDPETAADAAWASADLFAAAARFSDGQPHSDRVTQAADHYERAARPPAHGTPQRTGAGQYLRGAGAALLAACQLLPGETRQLLAVLAKLQSLATAFAQPRQAQGHAAQAAAVRAAAERLAATGQHRSS